MERREDEGQQPRMAFHDDVRAHYTDGRPPHNVALDRSRWVCRRHEQRPPLPQIPIRSLVPDHVYVFVRRVTR